MSISQFAVRRRAPSDSAEPQPLSALSVNSLDWALAVFAAWLPTALFGLYATAWSLKWRGYVHAAQILGRTSDGTGATNSQFANASGLFTPFEKLSFFRWELLIGWLLVPIVLFVASARIRPRIAMTCSIALSLFSTLLLYTQMKNYRNVGHFVSYGMMREAVEWAAEVPSVAKAYVLDDDILKLALVVAAIFLMPVAIRHPVLGSTLRRFSVLPWRRLYFCIVASVTAASCLSSIPSTTYHRSILVHAFTSLIGSMDTDPGRFGNMEHTELANEYQRMTGTPKPMGDDPNWGIASDFDLIFYVLETAPYRCLPLVDESSEFPNMSRLSQQAWVCETHYTTYPLTNYAVFSLLSSLHPPSMWSLSHREPQSAAPLPGVIGALRQRRYHTAAYSPITLTNGFHRMLKGMGIQQVEEFPKQSVTKSIHRVELDLRLEQDKSTINAALDDISHWTQADERYAVILLPQIGHAPWPALRPEAPSDVYRRGREICKLQDEWLGEIIEQLEVHGRLDRTLIVVTGDHGLRTIAEDPNLVPGMMSDISFHVPLLIYAGSAIDTRTVIRHPTSHVDVAPTLMCLLGVNRMDEYFQGARIWSSGLESRTVLFWADEFMGFSGFYEGGKFAMHCQDGDITYEATRMDPNEFALSSVSNSRRRIADKMTALRRLQRQWTKTVLSYRGNSRGG